MLEKYLEIKPEDTHSVRVVSGAVHGFAIFADVNQEQYLLWGSNIYGSQEEANKKAAEREARFRMNPDLYSNLYVAKGIVEAQGEPKILEDSWSFTVWERKTNN